MKASQVVLLNYSMAAGKWQPPSQPGKPDPEPIFALILNANDEPEQLVLPLDEAGKETLIAILTGGVHVPNLHVAGSRLDGI